jgi:hypothetical protein
MSRFVAVRGLGRLTMMWPAGKPPSLGTDAMSQSDRRPPAHPLGDGSAAPARAAPRARLRRLRPPYFAVFRYPGPQRARPTETSRLGWG